MNPNARISIFTEYSFGPTVVPHWPILTLCIFWFLSNRQPLIHKIIFLDTCQKTVSTHAPQFRSNRFVAPKLMLIIIANIQIYPHLPTRRCIESPFFPRAKVINISVFPSAGTFPVAPLPSLLLKNTSDLPPPLQPHRVSKTQVQESLSWHWRPSPRFQRYVSFLHPQHLFSFPF